MFPNTTSELLLSYLLSSIKNPSYLAQNLSFCQLDVWDYTILINCPSSDVFQFILKSKKNLSNAISKLLPSIKMVSLMSKQQVVDLRIEDHYSRHQRPDEVSPLGFDIVNLIKESAYPILVLRLDGQILLASSPQKNENFPIGSIYLNAMEAGQMSEAIELHGWVNGYRLKLDNSYDSKGIFITVRARVALTSLLDELVLIAQVLNTESIGAVTL